MTAEAADARADAPLETVADQTGCRDEEEADVVRKRTKKKKRTQQQAADDGEAGTWAETWADDAGTWAETWADDADEGEEVAEAGYSRPKKKKRHREAQPYTYTADDIEATAPEWNAADVGERAGRDDPTCSKVCIGMLSLDLNKEDIVEHFDFCGEITDAYLLKDVQQKKGYYTEVSRGICFVTFSNPKG